MRFWFLVATLLAVLSPALPSGLRLLAGASFPSVHGLLERLRAEAEAEAARPITPQQQRSISYAHKYYVEIAFGVRQKQSNRTAAQQMGLAATPAPATEVILAPAVEAPALVPHAWWAAAASLTTAELNRTLVALQPEKHLLLAADFLVRAGLSIDLTTIKPLPALSLSASPALTRAMEYNQTVRRYPASTAEGERRCSY